MQNDSNFGILNQAIEAGDVESVTAICDALIKTIKVNEHGDQLTIALGEVINRHDNSDDEDTKIRLHLIMIDLVRVAYAACRSGSVYSMFPQIIRIWAISIENEVVDLQNVMLTAGIDYFNIIEKLGETPMMYAIRNGHWRTVKLLLQHGLHGMDKVGNVTYIERSSHYYDVSPQITWCLILHGCLPGFEMDDATDYVSFNQDDWRHVIENNEIKFEKILRIVIGCLLADRIEEAYLILNAYFIYKDVSQKNKKKIFRQLTVGAVENYCCNIVGLLRNFDVQYNQMSDKYWQSLLLQCIELGADEHCGYLLEMGVKPHFVLSYPNDLPTSVCRAFSLACQFGRVGMLEGMLQAWSLPDSIICREISLAVNDRNFQLLEKFLQYSGQSDNYFVRCALHRNDSQLLKYMLDHGIDPDIEFSNRLVQQDNATHFCLFEALFSAEAPQYEDDDFDNITARFLCAIQLLSQPYRHYANLHELGKILFLFFARTEEIGITDDDDLLNSMDTNVILFMSKIGFNPTELLAEYVDQCDEEEMFEWANGYTRHFVEKALRGMIEFMTKVVSWNVSIFYRDVVLTYGDDLGDVNLTTLLVQLSENHNEEIARLSEEVLELWQYILSKTPPDTTLHELALLQAVRAAHPDYSQIIGLPSGIGAPLHENICLALLQRANGEMVMPMQIIAREYWDQHHDSDEPSS